MHRPVEGILGNLILCFYMNEQYKAPNGCLFEVSQKEAIADTSSHCSISVVSQAI